MFIKAQSKQRFGDPKEPFINLDLIVSAEVGHDKNVNVKMTNGEELTVSGDWAAKLLIYLEEHRLK